MTDVIPPSFFQPVVEETTKLIKRKPRKTDDEDLLSLAESDSWKKLRSIIEGKQEKIRMLASKTADSSTDLNVIGLTTLIERQVNAAYQSIIDLVELRKKAKYAQSAGKQRTI